MTAREAPSVRETAMEATHFSERDTQASPIPEAAKQTASFPKAATKATSVPEDTTRAIPVPEAAEDSTPIPEATKEVAPVPGAVTSAPGDATGVVALEVDSYCRLSPASPAAFAPYSLWLPQELMGLGLPPGGAIGCFRVTHCGGGTVTWTSVDLLRLHVSILALGW